MSRSDYEPDNDVIEIIGGDDSSTNVKGDHASQGNHLYTCSASPNLLTSSPSPSPLSQCSHSPPPQCTTPISIMYDFLAHHNLPCKYKPTFEFNAQKCLLALGDRNYEERGDRIKMTPHPREQRRKKKQSKRYLTKEGGAINPQSSPEHPKDDDMQDPMTSEEIFARIMLLLSPKLTAEVRIHVIINVKMFYLFEYHLSNYLWCPPLSMRLLTFLWLTILRQ